MATLTLHSNSVLQNFTVNNTNNVNTCIVICFQNVNVCQASQMHQENGSIISKNT